MVFVVGARLTFQFALEMFLLDIFGQLSIPYAIIAGVQPYFHYLLLYHQNAFYNALMS